MSKALHRRVLIALTVSVWTGVAVLAARRLTFSAKSRVTVRLAAQPLVVRITVDSERLFDGAYVHTPLTFQIASGHHRLKISRDGYVAHATSVDAEGGETVNMSGVVLQRNPDAKFANVEIDVVGDDKMPIQGSFIQLDDGHVAGEPPLTSDDLVAGEPHRLTFYPDGFESGRPWECRFTPPVPGPGERGSHRIVLRFHGNRVTATGCERLRPRVKT